MSKNIPLFRFKPQFQYRLWGGGKLQTRLNKNCKDEGIGESWEISAVDGLLILQTMSADLKPSDLFVHIEAPTSS